MGGRIREEEEREDDTIMRILCTNENEANKWLSSKACKGLKSDSLFCCENCYQHKMPLVYDTGRDATDTVCPSALPPPLSCSSRVSEHQESPHQPSILGRKLQKLISACSVESCHGSQRALHQHSFATIYTITWPYISVRQGHYCR